MSEQADHTFVTAGVMDLLLGARSVPDIDDYKFAELVRLCLQTHAWCVREEYLRNLALVLSHGPISEEVIKELEKLAVNEHTDHVTRLSAYATSLLSNFTKH